MTRNDLTTSRIVATLLLVQIAGGALLNAGLLQPVFNPPGFLENAALHPTRLALAAVLGIALGALSVGVVIAAWPVFARHGQRFALWLLALATAGLALATLESATVLSLRSLSESYTATPDADATLFTALRGVVAAARNWSHYTNLIVAGLLFLSFYGLLYRFTLVPRALAGFGMLAGLLQMIAVSMPLFGHPIVFALLAPLGVSHLALAGWLLVKGFRHPVPNGSVPA